MNRKISKDKRDKTWAILERGIQSRAKDKDKSFILGGKWKKFIRTQSGHKIFSVDGKWIRTNLCVYFGHGGHDLVHEFIPLNEIWISSHHYDEGDSEIAKCGCRVSKKGQKVSKKYFDSVVIHEITECEEMKKGKIYWKSHQIALQKEREIGLLPDPFDDTTIKFNKWGQTPKTIH